MQEDLVVSVGIGPDRRLFVRPANQTFPFIYRTASDVRWDEARGVLTTNAPRDMSYRDWFGQIWSAVLSEYVVDLRLSGETEWVDVPEQLRSDILADQVKRARMLAQKPGM